MKTFRGYMLDKLRKRKINKVPGANSFHLSASSIVNPLAILFKAFHNLKASQWISKIANVTLLHKRWGIKSQITDLWSSHGIVGSIMW